MIPSNPAAYEPWTLTLLWPLAGWGTLGVRDTFPSPYHGLPPPEGQATLRAEASLLPMRSYHHPQVLTAGPGPKRSTPYSLEPGGGPSHSEMVPADVVYFGIRRWEDFLHFPGGYLSPRGPWRTRVRGGTRAAEVRERAG